MKSIFKYILLLTLFSSQLFIACDENSEDPSVITYYAVFEEVKGTETFSFSNNLFTMWELGAAYVDPGVVVTEGGKDVNDKLVVNGNVNGNKVGYYPVAYSVKNADGFDAYATRHVIVYDKTNIAPDISGNYKSNYSAKGTAIYQMAPGVFFLNDFMGFGFVNSNGGNMAAAFGGYFVLNSDNTIESLYSFASGFGATGLMQNGLYDPNTKTITYTFVAAAIGVRYNLTLVLQ